MPAPSRYAGTKIDANGRRVPADQFEEAEGAARSTKVDPETQIAADGTRKPLEEIDQNEVAPVGRTAEARQREERAAHVAESETPTQVNPSGVSADVESTGGDRPGAPETDDGDDGDGDESLDDKTKAELMDIAAELEIEGRSTMNKDELLDAVKAAR